MESIDFWEDSQPESIAQFDDSMNMIVPDSIGNGGEVTDDADQIVEDSCDERTDEAIVDFRGLKSRQRTTPKKVVHDFDLNKPSVEERLFASKYKEERDFDLNKLPIAGDEENPEMAKSEVYDERDFDLNKLPTAGRWHFSDGVDEREFILMLRILLPDYH